MEDLCDQRTEGVSLEVERDTNILAEGNELAALVLRRPLPRKGLVDLLGFQDHVSALDVAGPAALAIWFESEEALDRSLDLGDELLDQEGPGLYGHRRPLMPGQFVDGPQVRTAQVAPGFRRVPGSVFQCAPVDVPDLPNPQQLVEARYGKQEPDLVERSARCEPERRKGLSNGPTQGVARIDKGPVGLLSCSRVGLSGKGSTMEG
ncbi:MAG: hypothetical protein O9972_28820 [Burkholderiales bacterium]|nr:hypothetical protein [Burkholderiales bacterium]